jgi:hypothetical protein
MKRMVKEMSVLKILGKTILLFLAFIATFFIGQCWFNLANTLTFVTATLFQVAVLIAIPILWAIFMLFVIALLKS